MIVKQMDEGRGSGARAEAGAKAEQQMAFYLGRGFGGSAQVLILNDLRLVDEAQPEHDGRPGVCQIDHLVLHRCGVFIIESKSVTGEITVRDDGAGDEWTRPFRGRATGMPSPIQQAERQGNFLRAYLQAQRTGLLGRAKGVTGVIARLAAGTDQRSFRHMPIQIIVAISDSGVIKRVRGWEPKSETYETFVCKADQVVEKIQGQLQRHGAGRSLLSTEKDYGGWSMLPEEVEKVAHVLASQHRPMTTAARAAATLPHERPAPVPAPERHAVEAPVTTAGGDASCATCGGVLLEAKWGRSGYYWACGGCGGRTPIPTTCSLCGAVGSRGRTVRIRKEGPAYFRVCESCGIEERVF